MPGKLKEMNVLIIEDHALTRFGLKTALESLDHIKEVHEAEDGESGIKLCQDLRPDIVLVDLGLPGINGIEVTKLIKKFDNRIKILILTSHNNEESIWASLGAGANAYCIKDIEPDRLISVVESVCDGAVWFDPSVADMILKILSNVRSSRNSDLTTNSEAEEKIQLTERETEVLNLIVDGYSNAEIAEKLVVSIHTAKAHVCNILQKLSVDDRTQAAIKALRDGIV